MGLVASLVVLGLAAAPAAAAPVLPAVAPSASVTAPQAVSSQAGSLPTTTDGGSAAEVTELDLVGVDDQALAELETLDSQTAPDPTVPADAEPETAPQLEVVSPLAVLPAEADPTVVTERLSADPFSVMGVTWDRDPAAGEVLVQFRTFREGAWSDWGWIGASEEYLETTTSGPATRGATDPVFVPDSTGVQVLVSSTGVPVTGVKIVLVDPGAGPDGTGASTSSGEPTDASVDAADAAVPPAPVDPAPVDPTSPASPTAPSDPAVPSTPTPTAPAPTATTAPAPEPSAPATVGPGTGPTDQPVDPGTPDPTATPPEPDVAPTDGATTSGGGGGSLPVRSPLASVPPTADLSVPALPAAVMPTATMPQPRIVSRAAWGAAAPTCAIDYSSSTVAAAIHHTASTNTYTAAQVPGLLRGFAEYQMRPEAQGGRGWCDIGYNFLVDKFGTIYEGRAGGIDLPAVGVHTGGFNSRIVGVSAIGNYQDAVPSAALAEGLSQLIAWKFSQHRILANTNVTMVSGGGASKYPAGTPVTFSTIFGHRDAQTTACPGQYLYALFGDIRNRVAQLSNGVVAESPDGAWDLLAASGSGFRIAGWARDPSDTGRTVQVRVLVDGVLSTTIPAAQNRSDVGAHGFDTTIPAAVGTRRVCLRMVNIGGGSDVLMGCRTVTVRAANPVGALDAVNASSTGVYVAGWTRDPDTTSPIDVHVYANAIGTPWTANQPRPDVQAAAPGVAGPNHGFSGTIPLPNGRYDVCAYGINVGAGSNTLLGCRTVTVGSVPPPAVSRYDARGSLDVVRSVSPTRVQVAGWALDQDTTRSIEVHVHVDGRAVAAVTASGNRPDVASLYGMGAAHGFDRTLDVGAGRHEVCVYALDSNGGRNALLGCRTVGTENKAPIGSLDVVRAVGSSRVHVAGWALDPDTTASIQTHVYVDGRAVQAVTASGNRPDVAAAYGKGAAHGFDTTISVAAGRHEVCVYALDSDGGRVPQLGCRTVTVTNAAPVGSVDVVRSAGTGQVQLAGWALDPDTSASIQVHAYVDGRAVQAITARDARPDVAAAYGRGAAHGFDVRFPVASGTRQVCAYALDSEGGRNTLLGCQTVSVP